MSVIVTGAGGAGCGRAIAARFAREGLPVVSSDINEAGGRETVRQIEAAGGVAVFLRTDVRDDEQVRELLARALAEIARLAGRDEFQPTFAGRDWKPTPEEVEADRLAGLAKRKRKRVR